MTIFIYKNFNYFRYYTNNFQILLFTYYIKSRDDTTLIKNYFSLH